MRVSIRPARILSVLMLIAVVNVYVFADGAITSSNKAVLGRLVTSSNRPVWVNGGEAVTGSVILSGTQISTSTVSLATVNLPNVGVVSVFPNSNVTLNFDAKSVTVKVAVGDATVTTADGVVGTVVDAAGKPKASPSAPAPVTNNAQTWGIVGVAVGGAALIWAIIAHNRANDARDSANAANAAAASLASQLAALRTCLAGQTTSPIKLCTSF